MLVVIGVFSVMAYTVSLQTHEIGILIGLLASFGLTRLLASQIWGVSATDPLTCSAVMVAVVAVGLVASLLPARRATLVDPLIALRYE